MKDNILFEVRMVEDETSQSPGRLTGVLMPYETRASDRPEMFELGALDWPAEGILVRRMHEREKPIVKLVPFMDGKNLRVDAPLLNTAAGRDAATEVREGVLSYLSVEFHATKEARRNGLRVIQKAMLGGAGLVDFGSYSQAKVELRARSTPGLREARFWLSQ